MALEATAESDDELIESMPEIEALDEADLLAVHADPEAAAITALLVADYVEQPAFSEALSALASTGLVQSDTASKLKTQARALLVLLERLGGTYLPERRPPDRMMQKAEALRTEMMSGIEEALPGNVEVRLWLDAVRRGTSAVDLLFDLRTLATLYLSNLEALETFERTRGARREPPQEVARAARRTATMLEHSLHGVEAAAHREHRRRLARIWTLFVRTYDELCRACRLVSQGSRRDQSFPPLAMIAAHRRAKRRAASILPPEPPVAAKLELSRAGRRESIELEPGEVELLSVPPQADAPRPTPAKPPPPPRPQKPAKSEPTDLATPPILKAEPPQVDVETAAVMAEAPTAPATAPLETPAPAAQGRTAHLEERPSSAVQDPIASPEERPTTTAPAVQDPIASPEPTIAAPDQVPPDQVPEEAVSHAETDDKSTSVAPGRDVRTSARRAVQVEVGVFSASNFYLGFTENLSDGGVFIATYRALPIGSEVDIQLELPTGSLHATGVVRWLRTVDACEDWPGMGVQFANLAEDAQARIREFIDVRDPLFFGD